MNAIKRNIPNSITCCNLFSGCVACVFAFWGNFDYAAFAVVAAAVFDFFDGFAARGLKAYSPMGKELDSLADDVSFCSTKKEKSSEPDFEEIKISGDLPF